MSWVIPVVMHRLVRGAPERFEDVRLSTFEEMVTRLRDRWTLIDRVCQSPNGSFRYVITFDDGNASDAELALPVLRKHGVGAVFFPVTSWIGRPGYLSWAQIRTLKEEGMQIGSHSVTHIPLPGLDPDVCAEELLRSREIIEDRIGAAVTTFAFPFGAKSRRLIVQARSSGYDYCCTSDHGLVQLPAAIIPRNSINRTSTGTDVEHIITATATTRVLWWLEDTCKAWLKGCLGTRSYRNIRSLVARHD